MTKCFPVLALCCAACATPGASNSSASGPMKELQALDRQGAYRELWDTLSTVPPSERNAEWLALAERAAIAKLDLEKSDYGRPDAEAPLALANEMLVRYPTLKTSQAFADKRFEVALTGFQHSYSSSRHSSGDDPWLARVKAFASAEPRADAPRRLAKEVVLKQLIPITAFPLVKLAIEREGKAVCADAQLRQSVVDAVEEKTWVEDTTALLTGTCAAELRPAVVAAIGAEKATYAMKKNGCALLKPMGGADLATLCP